MNTADLLAEARRETTSKERLQELASLSNELAEAVAQNVAAPPELLSKLAKHDRKNVRKADNSKDWFDEYVANNFNQYPETNSNYTKKDAISSEYKKISETPSFSREALFLSDYAASFVLAENSNSISWLERYAIAQNPNTLRDTLEVLAQDGNRIVKATAKESLEKLNRNN